VIRKRAGLLPIIAFCALCLAQSAKVESLPPLTDAAVPEAVRKVLDAKGYRVLLKDGNNVAELWFRKEIPKQSAKNSSDALYPQLAESTLIAVLRFQQPSTDYRGQPIRGGYYTLRYELSPNDGNHLGAAPSRDFVLLIPAATDRDPASVFTFQELVALSRKATSTRHPGPLSLVDSAGGTGPAVTKDDQDHSIFSAVLKLAGGEDLPFALVVKGTASQ
jgi:hypothetical protein